MVAPRKFADPVMQGIYDHYRANPPRYESGTPRLTCLRSDAFWRGYDEPSTRATARDWPVYAAWAAGVDFRKQVDREAMAEAAT